MSGTGKISGDACAIVVERGGAVERYEGVIQAKDGDALSCEVAQESQKQPVHEDRVVAQQPNVVQAGQGVVAKETSADSAIAPAAAQGSQAPGERGQLDAARKREQELMAEGKDDSWLSMDNLKGILSKLVSALESVIDILRWFVPAISALSAAIRLYRITSALVTGSMSKEDLTKEGILLFTEMLAFDAFGLGLKDPARVGAAAFTVANVVLDRKSSFGGIRVREGNTLRTVIDDVSKGEFHLFDGIKDFIGGKSSQPAGA